MKNYQSYVDQINQVDWSRIEPLRIIHVSLCFAKEFAQTVRSCIPQYHHLDQFQQFIVGEIDTDNLQYEGYTRTADHWQFLDYFLDKERSHANFISLQDLIAFNMNTALPLIQMSDYVRYCDSLEQEQKLLTLVSREKELQGIFQKILVAHDWGALRYGFYKYFLERHLELDGVEGGHEDLMKSLVDLDQLDPQQEIFLEQFWQKRLAVYQSL